MMRSSARLLDSPGKLLLLAVVMALAGFACGDGGIVQADDPKLETDPNPPLYFSGTEGEVRTIEISNDGDGDLRLYNVELENHGDEVFVADNDEGDQWPDEELRVSEDETLTLAIEYVGDGTEASGSIVLGNNDTSIEGEKIIELRVDAGGSDLFVDPSPIDFAQTPATSSDWQVAELHNIGDTDLEIDNIEVTSGYNDFSTSFFAELDSDGTYPSAEDDVDAPQVSTIEPGGDPGYVRVIFDPDNEQPSEGQLTITYNGGLTQIVNLSGNSGDACLEVSDEEGIDFGPAALNDTTYHTLTMRNCSPEAELNLFELSIADDGGGVFALDEESLPGALPDGDEILQPGETVTTLVGYTPSEEQADSGELVIHSDDSQDPELRLSIDGEGVDAKCPVAEVAGSVDGAAASNPVPATNQDVVQLSSEGSYDPDGTDLTYEWSVINRPEGSLTQIEPSPTDANPEMEVDIVGYFQLELKVYDAHGLSNCDPAILDVNAAPSEDIHVQLVWSAPEVEQQGGPNPSMGIGTDLDVHYVHQDGFWGDFDSLYYARPEQDWGNDGVATLDVDALYGSEPENITHSDPAPDRMYRVGVHYYCDNGFGATDATVRIYFGDSLYSEETERLEESGHFWYMGNIAWDPVEPTVHVVDNYQQDVTEHLDDCESMTMW